MDIFKCAPTKSGVPIDHLDYAYIEKCSDIKELEKILKELRSGNEGFFPDLERFAEKRIEKLEPSSKVLRKEQAIPSSRDLGKATWDEINEDLKKWTEGMENSGQGAAADDSSDLPPVRGSKASINTSKGMTEKQSKQRTNPVKPRDYREWDKLDVDAELAKVDDKKDKPSKVKTRTESASPAISTLIDTTNLTDQQKYQKAEQEKSKGNEAFRAGDYEEALLYYSRSISLVPTVASHNNRAQTYVKLKRWHSAISDCNTVLKMEPNNIKAYLRRAVAYQGQHELIKAKADLSLVLQQEPANKRAKDLLDEVEKALAEQKVRGRRMVIEEVEGSDDDDDDDDNDDDDDDNGGNKDEGDDKEEEVVANGEVMLNEKAVKNEVLKPYIEEVTTEDNSQSAKANVIEGSDHTASSEKDETNVTSPADIATDQPQQQLVQDVKHQQQPQPQQPSSPPVIEPPPLPDNVSKLKEKGNSIYRNGHYGEATEVYTEAINALLPELNTQCPNLAVLYNNRAACKYKMGDCSGCVQDCSKALELTPGAVKPLARRAMAYETLEKFRDAYVDYRQILSLDASVDIAQQGSTRCTKMLMQLDGPQWRDKLPKITPIIPSAAYAYPTQPKSSASEREQRRLEQIKLKQLEEEFNKEKDAGNTCVQKGNFQKAVEHYSECIRCCPDKAVGYTNRALCYLRLNKAALVIEDCNRALSIDFENAKGLFRRGQAYKMEGKYEESITDLQTLLKIDPRNAAAKKELDIVETYKQEHEARRQEEAAKRVLEQEKRRVHIEEVEGSSDEEEVSLSSPSADKQKRESNQCKAGNVPDTSSRQKPVSSPQSPTNITSPSLSKGSPYEFMHAWTSLKGVKDILPYVELIQQVPPADFPKVISNKLDGEMLMTIVQAADTMISKGLKDDAYSYLAQLTKVPRFNMVTMFMSSSDKHVVTVVFRKLKEAASTSTVYCESILQKLMKAFGL